MVITILYFSLADTTETIPICFFGLHLSKAETAVNEYVTCNGSLMKNFSSIEKEVQEIIVYRSCVRNVDETVMICVNHEDFLGKQFTKSNASKYCFWPSHSGKRSSNKDLRNPFPTKLGDERKQSLFLYSNHGIILPFQSKVCKKCQPKCNKNLEGFIEDAIRSPIIRRSTLDLGHSIDSSPSLFASQASSHDFVASQASSHDVFSLPSQDKHNARKECLDDFISENKIQVKVKSCLENDWDTIGPRRQRQVLNYAAAGVAGVLNTIAHKNNQSGLLYRKLVESNYVEKYLSSDVPL